MFKLSNKIPRNQGGGGRIYTSLGLLNTKNCKQNTPHGSLNTRNGQRAFTLVELIVVIVILGILGTIGFLAFGNYPKQARDVVRVSNVNQIEEALELYKAKYGDYPLPTNANTGTIEGFSGITWHMGEFGEDITSQIEAITETPTDPQTNTPYNYAVTENLQSYRITTTLELENETTGTKEHIVNNKLTYPRSCKQILDDGNSTGNGNYIIRPNGQEIEVKCDMTNGGYTRYLHIKQNYSFEDAKNCWLGKIVNNTNIECFNPNRFGMYARDFKLIQTRAGTTHTYTYINPNPKPSTTHKRLIENEFGAVSDVLCEGGTNYMTKNKYVGDSTALQKAYKYYNLGLTYCLDYKPNWQIGTIVYTNNQNIIYLNYHGNPNGKPVIGTYGIRPPNPFNPSSDYPVNTDLVEIYIK